MEDQSHRAKGKRTKRQRLQLSPSNSISEADGEGEIFGQHQRMIINGEDYFSLTSNSNDHHDYDGSDESKEDEDLANCLILLAQGQSWNNSLKQGYELPSSSSSSSFKFNSRRFMEAADNGKAGCYVYECKTCNRRFPSFQALGGHRASHKKPLKAAAMELVNEKKLIISQLSPNIEPQEKEEEFKNNNSNPIELSFSRTKYSYKKLDFKIHECSVCGAEFMSGQALGGHMRRHRRGLTSNGRAPSVAAMAMEEGEEIQVKKQRSLLSLDLDLNLPAAPEDDHREQQTIVFSTPSLVGCHY